MAEETRLPYPVKGNHAAVKINSIDFSGSVVDGPGIRTVLYVQGCGLRCPGCHNPSTWPLEGGTEVSVEDLIAKLRAKAVNRKLTISGGEPLLQVSEVISLVVGLPDFSIALYTGNDLDDVPQELLEHLDYVKVGSYQEESRTTITPYVGSANQRFIYLRGSGK